jgi:hypothetical protein
MSPTFNLEFDTVYFAGKNLQSDKLSPTFNLEFDTVYFAGKTLQSDKSPPTFNLEFDTVYFAGKNLQSDKSQVVEECAEMSQSSFHIPPIADPKRTEIRLSNSAIKPTRLMIKVSINSLYFIFLFFFFFFFFFFKERETHSSSVCYNIKLVIERSLVESQIRQ